MFFKKVLIAYIVGNKYKHYILYILLEKAGMFGITHIFKYLLYFIYDLAGIMLKSYRSIDSSKSVNSKMKIMNDKFVGRIKGGTYLCVLEEIAFLRLSFLVCVF